MSFCISQFAMPSGCCPSAKEVVLICNHRSIKTSPPYGGHLCSNIIRRSHCFQKSPPCPITTMDQLFQTAQLSNTTHEAIIV
ncbi:hypothetical protein GDO86_005555 [Hymenochirus boettgeri]|uniref:Uncharacterized protein n=1 Tax=Hymenochirus boettgeri TaxID=247094 RepID=A0A8T2J2C4_9PIPI|nr:hypothetical protein GDO86_005555 [Hymenochirus boettgeri]